MCFFGSGGFVQEGPTQADLNYSCFLPHYCFGWLLRAKIRGQVFERLNTIVLNWVARVYRAEGYSDEQAERTGTRILTFGSCCLGVNQSGGDVDTLIIAPKLLDRNRDVGRAPYPCKIVSATDL